MLLGAIWGSSYLVMRMSGAFLDPLPMIGVRLLSSALLYAVLMTRWRMWPAFRKQAAVTYLLPLFAMFWGWLILGEPINRGEIACGTLIALAVYLVNRR